MNFIATIAINRKNGVADPEGNTILEALQRLSYCNVKFVKAAKLFKVGIEGDEENSVRKTLEEISQRILSNPIIENFEIISIDTIKSAGKK